MSVREKLPQLTRLLAMGLSLPPPLLLLLLCVAPLVDAQATAPPPVCPVPPGVDAGAPTSVCVSGSVTLTGTQTGSTATVAWSGGPGTFSSPTALTTNFDPANGQGGKTLTLTLTGHSRFVACAVFFPWGFFHSWSTAMVRARTP